MSTSSVSTCFSTGIGGIGNIHPTSERARASFNEEVARSRLVKSRTSKLRHFGIGGMGNKAEGTNRRVSDAETLVDESCSQSTSPLKWWRRKIFGDGKTEGEKWRSGSWYAGRVMHGRTGRCELCAGGECS